VAPNTDACAFPEKEGVPAVEGTGGEFDDDDSGILPNAMSADPTKLQPSNPEAQRRERQMKTDAEICCVSTAELRADRMAGHQDEFMSSLVETARQGVEEGDTVGR
jgi:hypothetical protein